MKDSITLKIKAKETLTHIYFCDDLFEDKRFLKTCQEMKKRFVILTDRQVAALYAKPLLEFLEKHDFDCALITINSGEKQKSRKSKEHIEDEMFAKTLGRDTTLIALGGGVISDLGGFVAATYCRGIPYLTIPTSLLGMVDASIGGKTGVNVVQGKNLIGALYPPLATFIDLSMLATLPDREILNGSAEIVKYGLTLEHHIYDNLVDNLDKWQQRDPDFYRKLIIESCKTKKRAVEAGKREILNFGHTIGHAIETIEGYQMPHGEAIAIGMVIESLISLKLGHLKEGDFDAIYRLFKVMGFPLTLSEKVTTEAMLTAMKLDKKSENGTPRFIILDGIGKVLPLQSVEKNLLQEALGWMSAEFQ